MAFNRPNRPVNRQQFLSTFVRVLVTPTPLSNSSSQSSINALYTTFVISVPAVADGGSVVLLGDSSVDITIGNGLWIQPGVPIVLSTGTERQLYEVQQPLTAGFCVTDPIAIPFTVWDVTTLFLVSAAPQNVGLVFFQETFK